jgi:hypothetical protein
VRRLRGVEKVGKPHSNCGLVGEDYFYRFCYGFIFLHLSSLSFLFLFSDPLSGGGEEEG